MTHYYKLFETPSNAEEEIKRLVNTGIDRDKINVVTSRANGTEIEDSSVFSTKSGVESSPPGTISLFGAAFAPIAAATAGTLLMVSGPMAAMLGAAAVGTGELAMLLTGFGVPKEKQGEVETALNEGKTLLHVESESQSDLLDALRYDEQAEKAVSAR